jgi:hypothetical protein
MTLLPKVILRRGLASIYLSPSAHGPFLELLRLETDEDYHEVAWEKMPEALRQIGAGLGEMAWDSMQKAFSSGPFKPNRSSSDRRKFIENAAQKFCDNNVGNQEIEDHIIAQLRENKSKIGTEKGTGDGKGDGGNC